MVIVLVRVIAIVETNYLDPATPPPTHHPASPQRGGGFVSRVKFPPNQGVFARMRVRFLNLDLKLMKKHVNSREY